MVSKKSAQYTPDGTDAEHCSICSHHLPPDHCNKVTGEVVPRGWCKFFHHATKRAGDSLGQSEMKINLWGNIQKVDEQDDGTIIVSGIASTEAIDSAGEIVRAEALREAIPTYLSDFPALREMHGAHAAGSTVAMEVGDDNVTRIEALVTDPTSILKVKKKTLRGFSIGGRVTKRDPNNRKIITGVDLHEVSLVDRPACPDAKLEFWRADGVYMDEEQTEGAVAEVDETDEDTAAEVAKSDGADIADTEGEDVADDQVEAEDDKQAADNPEAAVESEDQPKGAEPAEDVEKRDFNAKERKQDAKSGTAMQDGSFPIENKKDLRNAIRLAGNAKNPAAARAHIKRRAKALGAEDMIPDTWKGAKKVANAADTNDKLEKDTTAAPIGDSKVGEVMGDDDGPRAEGSPGTPVAGAKVIANFPGGSNAEAQHSATGATDNDGQDSLSPSDVPVVDGAEASPTAGTEMRDHKHPAANKADEIDPISAAKAAADAALKAAGAAVDKASRNAGLADVPAPMREAVEIRKGIPEVSHLGYVLSELAFALFMAKAEADWEGDNSPVPGKLQKALDALADAYKTMSDEELAELMAQSDSKTAAQIAVALAGGDVAKAFEGTDLAKAVVADGLAKATDRIAALETERDDLLKVTSDLTAGLETLGKRVEELAAMPMPAKTAGAAVPVETVIKAVTKEEDTVGITKAESAEITPTFTTEDVQKALDAMPADERADLLLRASLQRPIPFSQYGR
jgi:hypothetical protein